MNVAGTERRSDSAALRLCLPVCLVTGCRAKGGTLGGITPCDLSVEVLVEGVKILLKGSECSAAPKMTCTERCCNSDLSPSSVQQGSRASYRENQLYPRPSEEICKKVSLFVCISECVCPGRAAVNQQLLNVTSS